MIIEVDLTSPLDETPMVEYNHEFFRHEIDFYLDAAMAVTFQRDSIWAKYPVLAENLRLQAFHKAFELLNQSWPTQDYLSKL